MEKRTIAILSAFYAPWESGAERFAREIAEKLCGKYNFIILTSKNSKKATRREKIGGYEVRRLGLGCPLDKWLFTILAPVAAARLKPDIVHAVMESYAGLALALFKAISWKTPAILTLQSGDLDDRKKQRKIPYLLWKLIHLAPTHLTAISHYLAERAKRLGAPEDRVSIIPNGVDFKELRPLISDPPERARGRIVCVGRLSWEKGQSYLISALPLIRKEFPEAHIVFVGDGADEEKLKKLAHSLDLDNFVFFRGKLPHLRAMTEAAKGSVFVGPSLAEGLGTVFLEAQALGTPVVGSYAGGIPDVVENEITGLLVPPKDSQAIAGAVKRIFGDSALAARLTQTAKERIHGFSWTTIADSVSSLYDRYL